MNRLISRYGTFMIIPPILAIIAFIAFRFEVTTKAEVILVQTASDEIIAYVPFNINTDSLVIETSEYGKMSFPIISSKQEETLRKFYCCGNLPSKDTLLHAYIVTGKQPIYRILVNRL